MTPPQARTFVERSGPDAAAELSAIARRCRAGGASVGLLRSRDEPQLYLLTITGDVELEPSERDGARVWRFETTPEAEPDAR